MSTELWIYRTRGRWRVWVALGCAATLHLAAVAFGRVTRAPESMVEWSDDGVDVVVTTDAEQAAPPLPDAVDDPIPTLPVPDAFPEETTRQPPRPRRIRSAPIPPVNNVGSRAGAIRSAPARVTAMFAPRPDYPYEARREHRTGSGIAGLTVNEITGEVMNAEMIQSTGNVILDASSLSAFRRWRFKPGTVRNVRIPITFSLNGVSY